MATTKTLSDVQVSEMRAIATVCEMAQAAARSAIQRPGHAKIVQWDKVARDLRDAAKSAGHLQRLIKGHKGK